jgi:hypothetical protein
MSDAPFRAVEEAYEEYQRYPERDLLDTFVSAAASFIGEGGTLPAPMVKLYTLATGIQPLPAVTITATPERPVNWWAVAAAVGIGFLVLRRA